MSTIEEKINSITGSIKKEQWRMRKANENCSVAHATYLDNLVYSLFDLEESITNQKSNTENSKNEEDMSSDDEDIHLKNSFSSNNISFTDSNTENELFEETSSYRETVENKDLNIEEKTEESIFDSSDDIKTEDEQKEDSFDFEVPSGVSTPSDFTYSIQKFGVSGNGLRSDIYIAVFPLTDSKDEQISIPIVAHVSYEGKTSSICSFESKNTSLTLDLGDFKISIRGYVDNKRKFHAAVNCVTEDVILRPLGVEENTNSGLTMTVMKDQWQDKEIYAFPLNVEASEFLFLGKNDVFTDYRVWDPLKNPNGAVLVGNENEENSIRGFFTCSKNEEGLYEISVAEF